MSYTTTITGTDLAIAVSASAITVDLTKTGAQGAAGPTGADGVAYDDTAIQAEVDLNTAKVTNVAHPLVETAVPTGAVFTDTVYDDTAIQDEVDLNTVKVTADTTNVTAAGALMDSEVTNLAQVKAFDTTDYATAAQGTAADAALPKTGGTMTGDIVVKGVTETNFALTGTTPAIDPANGTIQTWTLSAASTPTFAAGWSANEGITIMIDDGTAYAITWPTMQWAGGAAPSLPTTGYGVVTIWKEGAVYYGVSAGDMS